MSEPSLPRGVEISVDGFPKREPRQCPILSSCCFAKDLRARAKAILAQAETMKDADARQKMREIAEDYESWAERLEHHSCNAEKV